MIQHIISPIVVTCCISFTDIHLLYRITNAATPTAQFSANEITLMNALSGCTANTDITTAQITNIHIGQNLLCFNNEIAFIISKE